MTRKVTDEEAHIDGGPSCQPFARAVSWLQIAFWLLMNCSQETDNGADGGSRAIRGQQRSLYFPTRP